MKIVRFDAGNGARIGVVNDKGIVDLAMRGLPYDSIMDVIIGGDAAQHAILSAISSAAPVHRIDQVRLLAPIRRPGKYLAIGMNYKKHIEESVRLGVQVSKHQYWFNKQTSCIIGPHDEVLPGVTQKLDYEVELGVVIGKPAKAVSVERAKQHVFGYFVANDITARDWQFHSPTFTVGKSFDTHGPTGPWIVTADDIPDPHALDIRCMVNGEVRQSSNTRQMIYNIYQQIAYLSTAFTLEPGDLLATGTPEGVGAGMNPPVFLQPGDVVRCEIQDIGSIENRVASN